MKHFHFLILPLLLLTSYTVSGQDNYSITVDISVEEDLLPAFREDGRLFLFLDSGSDGEPRHKLWPVSRLKNQIFAFNISWKRGTSIQLDGESDMMKTAVFDLEEVPAGDYQLQVLWDQDNSESRINAPGNLHSEVIQLSIKQDEAVEVVLSEIIPRRKLVEHPLVKEVTFRSDTLSSWWQRDYILKVSLILPSSYFETPGQTYPVRYNVAGYGGRYTRINGMMSEGSTFEKWWTSDASPQILNVYLDGEGPFGDSYQLDSENNGPFGYALIHELIPFIEENFRGRQSSEWRYVDGCSTGGWVSLALQLYYPDQFNGVWSYSPDAIEFENYQLVNIYQDENLYRNEWGNERPLARDLTGDPIVTAREFLQYENVLGNSNTYLNSGGQFSAHTALYSPKGSNGLPAPLFDPQTGVIDRTVAEHWKKYDMKIHLEQNWAELGPQLEGKIYIWMGDMDHFFLNPATRAFAQYIRSLNNPVSDAVIEFEAMQGHCTRYSQRRVLEQIQEKIQRQRTEVLDQE